MVGKPFSIGENPQVDAQFSIPYAIALAIARRHVFIDDFDEDKIRSDTQVLGLADRVRVIGDQGSVKSHGRKCVPCVIEIRARGNKAYSQRVEIARGSPGKEASMEDVVEKFRKCCAFSAKPMTETRIKEIIRVISNLESVSDVSSLVRLIT